jgi:16S rRNA (cytidine1402-2'-O)-methyltransferase
MGTLYLVATPIGNLEDITYRAVRTLREVSVIAAEDTRTTRKLLTHYEIHTPLISFHEYSDAGRIDGLIRRLQDEDVAIVSEAGMPAISDPGYRLVRAAIDGGVSVTPVPGPSALVAAVAASGLPTDRFLFIGFLPSRAGPRRNALKELRGAPFTLICYESPHRLLAMLQDALQILGDRRMAAARELTKLHEEIWRGAISEALDYFGARGPRGEFTLVIDAPHLTEDARRWSEAEVVEALGQRRRQGLSAKDAAHEVAELAGWSRRDVYRLGVQGKRTGDIP